MSVSNALVTPKIINIIGEPSAGKSTLALELTANLKRQGVNAELVTEFVKDLIWDNNLEALNSQEYIFAEQHKRIKRLVGKVDVIVTDSPLILSTIYIEDTDTCKSLIHFIEDTVNSYDNDYYYIKRNHSYQQVGRIHTEDEAKVIGTKLDKICDEVNAHVLYSKDSNYNIGYIIRRSLNNVIEKKSKHSYM